VQKQVQKQIPFGNDNQKGKGKGKGKGNSNSNSEKQIPPLCCGMTIGVG